MNQSPGYLVFDLGTGGDVAAILRLKSQHNHGSVKKDTLLGMTSHLFKFLTMIVEDVHLYFNI